MQTWRDCFVISSVGDNTVVEYVPLCCRIVLFVTLFQCQRCRLQMSIRCCRLMQSNCVLLINIECTESVWICSRLPQNVRSFYWLLERKHTWHVLCIAAIDILNLMQWCLNFWNGFSTTAKRFTIDRKAKIDSCFYTFDRSGWCSCHFNGDLFSLSSESKEMKIQQLKRCMECSRNVIHRIPKRYYEYSQVQKRMAHEKTAEMQAKGKCGV